ERQFMKHRARTLVRRSKLLLCFFFVAVASAPFISGSAADQAVDFARDIRPIFEAACYKCHGPKVAQGQLRLDDKKSALKGGISGAAIIPGEAGKSPLLRRILGEGGEARMPMGGAPLKLAQVEMIRKWIDQGAEWPDGERESGRAGERESGIQKHW